MNLTGAIVLFAVIWFLTFYIVLMLRTRTQAEEGAVVPGTPPGAPAHEDVGKSARIASVWAALIWALIAGVILSGSVSIRDIDVMGILGPEDEE
ncbi:DUF1467 family protein [Pseudogemmobacter sonorensis]|uniref:DUF1467 family protein n=1 Tax=Pseudogemmobacter sonorensis TaxID=2989681 RepID=UPI003691F074